MSIFHNHFSMCLLYLCDKKNQQKSPAMQGFNILCSKNYASVAVSAASVEVSST